MNQKVYDIILKVKNTAYEKDTIRLLEYIFQDINNNLIATKINKLENEIKSLDPSKTPMYEIAKKKEILNTRIRAYSILKKELKTIIVSDNSIITYLDELLTDNNIGYINDIFKTFSSFFIILDHHLYENLNPFSFIFNVYIILATYHYNKENAKNFYKILKVCQQIHPFDLEENLSQRNFYNPEYDYRNELTFAEKKDLFDSLISIEEYSEYDIFDDVISAFLDLVSTTNSDDLIRIYKKRIELAKEIIKDKKELEQNKFLYKTINDQEIITALFKTKNLETFHYNKSILVNDHYKYLQENLKKIENNANIQKEIQDKILNINPIIFDYLTKLFSTPNHQEDYFIILLDIVFDSDSYFELNNKINTLITESQNLENKSKVFNENYKDELLAKLNSLELKEKRKNKLIMYEKSSKVPIVKPNTITERMQELYQSIYKDWITNINLFKYYGDHCDNLTDRQSKLNNDVIVIEKEIENRKKREEEHNLELSKKYITYFKNELDKVEENEDFKAEILSYLTDLNLAVFEEFNKYLTNKKSESEEDLDSFEVYTYCILNSDSYSELLQKLEILKDTVTSIEIADEETGLNLLHKLKSEKLKVNFQGKDLVYKKGEKKEQTIIKRMQTLYERAYKEEGIISENNPFIDIEQINKSTSTIEEFYDKLNSALITIQERKFKNYIKDRLTITTNEEENSHLEEHIDEKYIPQKEQSSESLQQQETKNKEHSSQETTPLKKVFKLFERRK